MAENEGGWVVGPVINFCPPGKACLCACCLYPWARGVIAERAGGGVCFGSKVGTCACYCCFAFSGFHPCLQYIDRRAVKKKTGARSGCCEDVLYTTVCPCCETIQVYKQLEAADQWPPPNYVRQGEVGLRPPAVAGSMIRTARFKL